MQKLVKEAKCEVEEIIQVEKSYKLRNHTRIIEVVKGKKM